MSTRNRRRADRVEVGIPAQIYAQRGFLDASVRDISRTGLRLRLRVADLGMKATNDMAHAARAVGRVLAPHFALDLDYKKLGPLLQRPVQLTRIALDADAPLFLELCGEFDEPLDDEIVTILGEVLPPVRDDVPSWTPEENAAISYDGVVTMRPRDELTEKPVQLPDPAAASGPAAAPVRHRYRALVTGTSKDAPPAFFCHTDLVTAVGVRVCLPRPSDAIDIRNAISKLVKVHGSSVDVRILDANDDVWSGSARVTGVELPNDRLDVMLVTLAYDRPLSMAAMRRMGLVAA